MKATKYATAFQDRVEVLVATWEPRLDLPGITVEHNFLDSRLDDDPTCAATTHARWQYRDAVIRWYMPAASHMNDDELEALFVHEYVHVMLAPLSERAKAGSSEYDELSTENVTRAIFATHRSTR